MLVGRRFQVQLHHGETEEDSIHISSTKPPHRRSSARSAASCRANTLRCRERQPSSARSVRNSLTRCSSAKTSASHCAELVIPSESARHWSRSSGETFARSNATSVAERGIVEGYSRSREVFAHGPLEGVAADVLATGGGVPEAWADSSSLCRLRADPDDSCKGYVCVSRQLSSSAARVLVPLPPALVSDPASAAKDP